MGLLVVVEFVAAASRYGHGDMVWSLPRHGVVVVVVVAACHGHGCSVWWWWWWLVLSSVVMINRKLPGHERCSIDRAHVGWSLSSSLPPCHGVVMVWSLPRHGVVVVVVVVVAACRGSSVWWWWGWQRLGHDTGNPWVTRPLPAPTPA